jgi:signal transduction histidine kinase
MLLPFMAASLLAAVLVAAGSFELGRRWAMAEVTGSVRGIEATVRGSNFPLTSPVLDSIASLTSTELLAFGKERRIQTTTLPLSSEQIDLVSDQLMAQRKKQSNLYETQLAIDGHRFLAYEFERLPMSVSTDRVASVAVLFDQDRIDAASRRAAMLPLATGLSTVILMTVISVLVSRRLVGRMIRLRSRVQRVAAGDFHSQVADASTDELGQLGAAVDSMASQLDQLWQQVNRQQGEKLLHQIASGMAHQLRNTLTGSRMAMELHRRDCDSKDTEEVAVAIRQLEIAEDYVARLLKVGAGQSQSAKPAPLMQCLADLESSHRSIAKHLQVHLIFEHADDLSQYEVADGVGFTSAIANLIINAMQAADCVTVKTDLVAGDYCHVSVRDNGPGVERAIADQVFEPFVTSKPEGMGLGLAFVHRAAKELGGEATWNREDGQTVFAFRCPITPLTIELTEPT